MDMETSEDFIWLIGVSVYTCLKKVFGLKSFHSCFMEWEAAAPLVAHSFCRSTESEGTPHLCTSSGGCLSSHKNQPSTLLVELSFPSDGVWPSGNVTQLYMAGA